jgi:hypothetical protein
MMYSSDGVKWTAIPYNKFRGVAAIGYGNGKFVAGSDTTGLMAASADGEAWTRLQDGFHSRGNPIRSIAYGNGKSVAVSNTASNLPRIVILN